MIELATSLNAPARPAAPAQGAESGGPAFASVLTDASDATARTAPGPADRQNRAATGNTVPESETASRPAGSLDERDDRAEASPAEDDRAPANAAEGDEAPPLDPALVWLVPILTAPPANAAGVAQVQSDGSSAQSPLFVPAPVANADGATAGLADSTGIPTTGPDQAIAAALSRAIDDLPVDRFDLSLKASHGRAAPVAPPAAAAAPLVPATATSDASLIEASILAAITVAGDERPKPARPLAFEAGTQFALENGIATPIRTVERADQPVQTGIDLARDQGLHRMIDRIEVLRDAADARDTRIRLVPDALGPVAIRVRQDGDSVRIHFTAAEAGTRQLIAEASPRLSELAEARGIRIDRATVDGGAAGDHPQGQAQTPARRQADIRNRAPAPAEADATTDHRIA